MARLVLPEKKTGGAPGHNCKGEPDFPGDVEKVIGEGDDAETIPAVKSLPNGTVYECSCGNRLKLQQPRPLNWKKVVPRKPKAATAQAGSAQRPATARR